MAKSSASSNQDSTPKTVQSQDNFLVKAEVYARLRNLHRFDTLVLQRMADNKYPGARKSLAEWDAFRAEYQNSGNTK
jgi:hypothetical protein